MSKRCFVFLLAVLFVIASIPVSLSLDVGATALTSEQQTAIESRRKIGFAEGEADIGVVPSFYAYVGSQNDPDEVPTVYTAPNESPICYTTVGAAANALSATGGFVVITQAIPQTNTLTVSPHTEFICYTMFDGIHDYRDNGAGGTSCFWSFPTASRLCCYGPTCLLDINIQMTGNSMVIPAQLNTLVIGNPNGSDADDVVFYCNGVPVSAANVSSYKVYLLGGYMSDTNTFNGASTESNLVVRSGKYYLVSGLNYNMSAKTPWNGCANICLQGNVYADSVYGSCYKSDKISTVGSVRLTVANTATVAKLFLTSNLANGYAKSNCYCAVYDSGSIQTVQNIAPFASSSGLYAVFVSESGTFPTNANKVFNSRINRQNNTSGTVYVKKGGAGNYSGDTVGNACPDLVTAYLILGRDGGTVKLSESYTLTYVNAKLDTLKGYECVSYGTSMIPYFIEPYHSGLVTILSNGESDYSISVPNSFCWVCSGDTTFGNVTLSRAAGTDTKIAGRFHNLSFTDAFAVTPQVTGASTSGYTVVAGNTGYAGGLFSARNASVSVIFSDANEKSAVVAFFDEHHASTTNGSHVSLQLNAGSFGAVKAFNDDCVGHIGGSLSVRVAGATVSALSAVDGSGCSLSGDFALDFVSGSVASVSGLTQNAVAGSIELNDCSSDSSFTLIASTDGDPVAFGCVFGKKALAIRTAAYTENEVIYSPGIRYSSQIRQALREMTVEDDGFALIEYGILVKAHGQAKELVYGNAAADGSSKVAKSICYKVDADPANAIDVSRSGFSEGDYLGFCAALVGIPDAKLDQTFDFRSYAVFENAVGKTFVIHGALIEGESIRDVASLCYTDGTNTNDDFAALDPSSDEYGYVCKLLGIS